MPRGLKNVFLIDELPEFSLVKVDVNCLITTIRRYHLYPGGTGCANQPGVQPLSGDGTIPIGGDFAYTLVPAKAETGEDLELTAEELETSYYQR